MSDPKPPPTYTAGIQIESNGPPTKIEGSTGALGCYALKGNTPVLLTCSHVMFPKFKAYPEQGIYQPSYSSCCSGGPKIATPIFDAAEMKSTGKFQGGFMTRMGEAQVPFPNEKGYTTATNVKCSLTDCAIATIDKGVMIANVLKAPSGDINIDGVNTDITSVLGSALLKAGMTPLAEHYVRFVSPNYPDVVWGTVMWHITQTTLDSKIFDGDEFTGKRVTPVWEFGISDNSNGPDGDQAAGTMPSLNQFLFLPRPPPIAGESDYTKFYKQPNAILSFNELGGDSGSVVVDYQGRVIGQIVRNLPFNRQQFLKPDQQGFIEFTSVPRLAVCSLIENVTTQLGITIPEIAAPKTTPWSSTGVGQAGAAIELFEDPDEINRRAAAGLRARLMPHRRGRLLLGKIGQHRAEVKRLFATVRAISAAWRDLGGAAFFHHALRSLRDPDHVIPTSINGVTRERAAEALLPLIAKYASPALRRDVERYGAWAVEALLPIAKLSEVEAAVERAA